MSEVQTFSWEWWEIFWGGICTLAIYSFLIKENAFYRIFEHIFIGISAGIIAIIAFRSLFWNQTLKPMMGLTRIHAFHPDFAEPWESSWLFYIIPMVFGMLYYFMFSKKHAWIAQLAIGFSLGVGAGLSFRGVFNELIPQVIDSFRPLIVWGSIKDTISNFIFILTLISSMTYFFFTFQNTEKKTVRQMASLGRWLMMGCFGAFFGSTIMARMSLLVERLQFLINRWWEVIIL